MVRVTCNNCGRKVDVNPDKIQLYCPYCGQAFSSHLIQTVLQQKSTLVICNRERTHRTEIEHEHNTKQTKLLVGIFIGAFIFLIAAIIFAIIMNIPTDEDHTNNGEVKVTASSDEFKGMNYNNVREIFLNAGFENVVLEENPDIVFGIFAKEGDVEMVSINGDTDFSKGDWFPSNSVVIIKYHTKK